MNNNDFATVAGAAENLHRREISALERAELEARWIEVVGEKVISSQVETKSKSNNNPKGAGRKSGGINKAASDLGKPRSSLHKSVKIASLSPDAKEAAKQHGLDNNQSALLTAGSRLRCPANLAEQCSKINERIDRLVSGEPRPKLWPRVTGIDFPRSSREIKIKHGTKGITKSAFGKLYPHVAHNPCRRGARVAHGVRTTNSPGLLSGA